MIYKKKKKEKCLFKAIASLITTGHKTEPSFYSELQSAETQWEEVFLVHLFNQNIF